MSQDDQTKLYGRNSGQTNNPNSHKQTGAQNTQHSNSQHGAVVNSSTTVYTEAGNNDGDTGSSDDRTVQLESRDGSTKCHGRSTVFSADCVSPCGCVFAYEPWVSFACLYGFYRSMLAMERSCRRMTSVCLSVCDVGGSTSRSAYWPFKVIGGRWFSCHLKGLMRLAI